LLSSSKIPNTGYNRHFKFLRDLIFRCPSSQVEQETIAEALSDADAAIESLEALIAKKRDVKQATMQQLLTGRTRLPGFTADWKEVRLGEHAAFFKGNGLSKSQLIDDGPQQCVHYGELFTHYGPVIENVTSKCVAFEGSFKSLAGDVLMPGSDVTPRGLATASAIKVSDVVLGGDVIVIRTKPTSLYGPFLSNFIRMSKGRVLRLVKGSTVYHIHAKDLADLEVLMPPLKEQEAIAETLSAMDDELEALTEQVSKLRMVKEGMMQDLLTGKVRLV
jgi:type I restriction enzyme S subunit